MAFGNLGVGFGVLEDGILLFPLGTVALCNLVPGDLAGPLGQ